MTNSAGIQTLFHNAIRCIDAGELPTLRDLLEATPALINTRSDTPAEGYFKHPYLLWFIAENPVRQGKMPANIVEITRLLIHFARNNAPGSFSGQLDTALGLVATSRVARESG